jgi:hypothetical protein
MAEMDIGRPAVSFQEILDAAVDFGLSQDEIWQTVDEALNRVAGYGVQQPECLDELAGALARSILAKQRRIASRGQPL